MRHQRIDESEDWGKGRKGFPWLLAGLLPALLNTEKERLLAGHLVTRCSIILLLSKRRSLLTLQ